jgi:hypothetical protein
MPPRQRNSLLTTLEAGGSILLARAAIAVLPMRWICSALGITIGSRRSESQRVHTHADAERIKERVSRIASRLPILGDCLPQSIGAAAMLRVRGVRSTLHFGVLPGQTTARPLSAHAWLTVGDVVVTGEGLMSGFVELRRQPTNDVDQ